MTEQTKQTLIGFFLECTSPGTPHMVRFLQLLVDYTKGINENIAKRTLADVLAFNSGLGCTPQEGYRDLVDALRDTQHLAVEKARAISEKE